MRSQTAPGHLHFLDLPQKWNARNTDAPLTTHAPRAQQSGAFSRIPKKISYFKA
jgi:hypothetical protein